jgi:WD repeat-containing protein 1 (actin-interacting protein 1)
MNSDLNIFDRRVGDKPSRIIQVCGRYFSDLGTITKVVQSPQKPIIAAVPLTSDTFVVGTASGRVLSFSSEEVSDVGGTGHSTLVSSIVSSGGGKLISSGFDDRVREIEGRSFTSVFSTQKVFHVINLRI